MAAREWPLLTVLLGAAAGLAVVLLTDSFRSGTVLIGASVVLAGWLRAFIPEDRVGLLAIRGRTLDVAAYLTVGLALMIIALIVPAQAG
jgi:membrane associated rhomboid family serine protease